MTVFIRLKVQFALWYSRVFYKLNRLDAINHLALGATLADAIALYGPPMEEGPSEDNPEATTYEFSVSPYHDATVTVWNGIVHRVAYWSEYPDPRPDLAWMLDTYGAGLGWSVMTEGYSFRRNDDQCWLFCSAAPVIGVGTTLYNKAKAEVRRKRRAEAAKESARTPSK